ncbi:hypothetical protein ACWDV4_05860 [Micromonospora sp. NPDC003197]
MRPEPGGVRPAGLAAKPAPERQMTATSLDADTPAGGVTIGQAVITTVLEW